MLNVPQAITEDLDAIDRGLLEAAELAERALDRVKIEQARLAAHRRMLAAAIPGAPLPSPAVPRDRHGLYLAHSV